MRIGAKGGMSVGDRTAAKSQRDVTQRDRRYASTLS
jgi:hypothetical protein